LGQGSQINTECNAKSLRSLMANAALRKSPQAALLTGLSTQQIENQQYDSPVLRRYLDPDHFTQPPANFGLGKICWTG
jgi:hypothetical protein